jgi:hypothetical protein
MQTFVHADIFFFISTIALVVLSVGAAVGLYYAIGILRDVREVSARINKASVTVEKDLIALVGFLVRKLTPKSAKRKKAKQPGDESL